MNIRAPLSSAAVFFMISVAALSYGEVIDKIAIVVNDEIVTEGEIERLITPTYEKYRVAYRGSALMKKLEEERQKVIEQLIDDKLMLSEAKKQGITVDDKEVSERVDEAMKRFGSKKNFEEVLAQQHITIKDLRQRYWEQAMIKRLVDKKIASKVAMTPVEVSKYYNDHKDEFAIPAEIKLWNILIKPDPINPKKRYELAVEIKRRIQEGSDFAGLAKVYSEGPNASEGGLMGYVRKGDLMPEIENAVFAMKEGEVSDIVQTSLGYHIFKVDEKRSSRTLSFEEARRRVEEAVFMEKMRAKAKEWVEGLKKNAYIAFK